MARGDWHGFMQFSARFYANPAANELYRDYVSQVIRRRKHGQWAIVSRRPGDHDVGAGQRTAPRHG